MWVSHPFSRHLDSTWTKRRRARGSALEIQHPLRGSDTGVPDRHGLLVGWAGVGAAG